MASSRLERIGTIYSRLLLFCALFYQSRSVSKMPKKNSDLFETFNFDPKPKIKKESMELKGKKNANKKTANINNTESANYLEITSPDVENGGKNVDKTFSSVVEKCKNTIIQELQEQNLSRKQLNEKMMENLYGILNQLEKDETLLKENNMKLNYVLEQSVKMSQQSNSALKQRITGLQKILDVYNKQCTTSEMTQTKHLDDLINNELKIVQDNLQNLSRNDKLEQLIQNLL